MFVFINVPTIRQLQSRPCENNHVTLDQLGVAVHHLSSFVSITISTISLWKVQAASCIDGGFIFFKLAKAGKTGQNI